MTDTNINSYDDNIALVQSTYDQLKRSDICIKEPDSILEKYVKGSIKIHRSLVDEHRLMIASCLQSKETEKDIEKKIKHIDNNSEGEEELSRRKGFYQGTQFWERNYIITLLEILYFTFLIINFVLNIKNISVTFILYNIFLVFLPYFTFNYYIYWLKDIYNYIVNNFNFYDNIYNHVK